MEHRDWMGDVGNQARYQPGFQQELRMGIFGGDEVEDTIDVAAGFRFNLRGLMGMPGEKNRRVVYYLPPLGGDSHSTMFIVRKIEPVGIAVNPHAVEQLDLIALEPGHGF